MPLSSEQDLDTLKQRFTETLDKHVRIRLFTESDVRSLLVLPGQPDNDGGSEYAKVTKQLLQELVESSPKLSLEILDVHADGADEARRLGIEQIPAIVLGDDAEGRVRFYGAPVGNEFPTSLTGIEARSNDAPLLRDRVADEVRGRIDAQVHLRVFVTPT